MSASLYDIPVKTIDGKDSSLGVWRGNVLLIVNVASQCGLTPQYEGLEKLYEDKRERRASRSGFSRKQFRQPGAWQQY
jgi:glutathione peroxidase